MTTLLRFITAGSVDDGKSTLIGRLLYDSRNVHDDHLETATRNLASLTDGLRAEREQGITIDVAYRYFATGHRKFIMADTPGHDEYTRNMATAASTADLAILLIDARHGLRAQTRRHARIASLLGVQQLVVAVNKMDLVEYDERVFRRIEDEFRQFAAPLATPAEFIPISAFNGDNVVTGSTRMPWYGGKPLLQLLEHADVSREESSFYFPIQLALGRGHAGQVASGTIHVGDEVIAFPSGRRSRVQSIVTFDGDLTQASAPLSVTLLLEDDLSLQRGDVIAAGALPEVTNAIEATLIWFDETPLDTNTTYLLKHTTRTLHATVRTDERVLMNDIVTVEIETAEPLIVKSYADNRAAGGFILIDPVTNATVAACMCHHKSHSPPPS